MRSWMGKRAWLEDLVAEVHVVPILVSDIKKR